MGIAQRRSIHWGNRGNCLGKFNFFNNGYAQPITATIETMTPAEIEKVFDWYSADLPQNATFQREIHHWSTFCQNLKDKPSSLFVAFILADSDYYPNIREIFHILLLTMPMGSVPCERSCSALRYLKQWNRTDVTRDVGDTLRYT